MSLRAAVIDFETKSVLELIGKFGVGAWVYSEHPTTDVLCMAYRLPVQPPMTKSRTKLWHPAFVIAGIEATPDPEDLFEWIRNGGLVEAHNAFFERSIWKNVMRKRYKWPKIKHTQWRCTAARCAAMSLPRALEKVAIVLNCKAQKDMAGHKTMLKCSKPRKLKKAERELIEISGEDPNQIFWNENPDDLRTTFKYCINDVDVEVEISEMVPELSPNELKVWQLDQKMNERGVYCDRKMVEAALKLTERAVKFLNAKLAKITGDWDIKASQRAQVKKWLLDNTGVDLPNMQGDTIDEYVSDEDTPKQARKLLSIVKSANRTSTAKYVSMSLRMAADDRIRDTIMYHGGHTGRDAGRGIQPQNFVRGYSKTEIMELACDIISEGNFDNLRVLFGEPMDALAFALRGALCAPKGRKLLSADFAAIEARVVLWMAGVKRALRILKEGGDLYLVMAKSIYRREVTKEDFMERQMGKQAVLGLGFGMGFAKFLITLRKYKISFTKKQVREIVGDRYKELEKWMRGQGKSTVNRTKGLHLEQDLHELILCKYVVDLYREEYYQIVELWDDMEKAAVNAVLHPGRVFEAGRVKWRVSNLKAGKFLQAMLPSGRKISYFEPRVSLKETPWGQKKATLSFMGEDSVTKRWTRQYTHGGSLVENVVQGCARDLMKFSMLRIEETGIYECILPVHDEVVAEADEDKANAEEYSRLMSRTPDWAEGLPVSAGGYMCNRYMKG